MNNDTVRIELPEPPALLQDQVSHLLIELGPIYGKQKADRVAVAVLMLVMRHYMEVAEQEGLTDAD